MNATAPTLEAVARLLHRIIELKRPRLRYTVGPADGTRGPDS